MSIETGFAFGFGIGGTVGSYFGKGTVGLFGGTLGGLLGVYVTEKAGAHISPSQAKFIEGIVANFTVCSIVYAFIAQRSQSFCSTDSDALCIAVDIGDKIIAATSCAILAYSCYKIGLQWRAAL